MVSSFTGTGRHPLVNLARGVFLGISNRGSTEVCYQHYHRCPQSEHGLINYLNNYNGGFFQIFNNPQGGYPSNHYVYEPPGGNENRPYSRPHKQSFYEADGEILSRANTRNIPSAAKFNEPSESSWEPIISTKSSQSSVQEEQDNRG